MIKYIFLIVLLLIAAFFAAKHYNYWPFSANTSIQSEIVVEDPEAITKLEQPEIQYPVPKLTPPPPTKKRTIESAITPEIQLPPLDKSDKPLAEEINKLVSKQKTKNVLLLNAIIPRFVATIDGLTKRKLSRKYTFSKPPSGQFKTQKDSSGVEYIDPKNYQRYSKYMSVLASIDNQKLVAVYVQYYPLFQQAYDDLGYPSEYFNDRLIEVIDHLLQTPEVNDPIKLNRPSVFYKFDDVRLEQLSAGQKILIRMGKANANRVKSILAGLRDKLTNLSLDL